MYLSHDMLACRPKRFTVYLKTAIVLNLDAWGVLQQTLILLFLIILKLLFYWTLRFNWKNRSDFERLETWTRMLLWLSCLANIIQQLLTGTYIHSEGNTLIPLNEISRFFSIFFKRYFYESTTTLWGFPTGLILKITPFVTCPFSPKGVW